MPRDGVKKERREIGRGPREQYRSVPRDGVKKKGERSVEDRESSIALCHGMALKEKGSVEDRESGVALCHKVALKKKGEREREIGRGPREQYRSVPRGGVKKEKREKK